MLFVKKYSYLIKYFFSFSLSFLFHITLSVLEICLLYNSVCGYCSPLTAASAGLLVNLLENFRSYTFIAPQGETGIQFFIYTLMSTSHSSKRVFKEVTSCNYKLQRYYYQIPFLVKFWRTLLSLNS